VLGKLVDYAAKFLRPMADPRRPGNSRP